MRWLFSQEVSVDFMSPLSPSIKRCSEAIEGRPGYVRPWEFTRCTLCLWASAMFECLWDSDGHFHSWHEINSLQPLWVLATGPAYQPGTGLAREACKWSSNYTPLYFKAYPPPCQQQHLFPPCFPQICKAWLPLDLLLQCAVNTIFVRHVGQAWVVWQLEWMTAHEGSRYMHLP